MLATLPTGGSGLGLAWTAEAGRSAAVTRPRATRTSGGGAAAGGGAGGAAVGALAVRRQDVLGSNHALRRDKGALMDQVRQLLCKKADLLSQARPPACPVAFPETFRVCEGCCSLPWTIWATWEVPELVTPPGTPTES